MPILLCRYILVDLIKTMALTTIILVTIIAFGAAIKPLANQQILDAPQTLKYVVLAAIPMLQFALPFAAGFAATMVFYRLVQDNEILAIRASGISHRQILMPVAALGILLTLIMLILTQSVIPRFWELMKRTIADDVTRMFEASLQSGRPFVNDGLQIYADQLYVSDAEDTDADRRLWLEHVAAVETGAGGRVITDITASRAIVDIYRRPDRTYVTLTMEDTVSFNRDSGKLISAPKLTPDAPIIIESPFDDDPMFMSRGELRRMMADPSSLPKLERARLTIARELQLGKVLDAIDAQLQRVGSVNLETSEGDARSYIVRAARVRDGRFVAHRGERIGVQQIINGRPRRIIDADNVSISSTFESMLDDGDSMPNLDLQIEDLTIRDADGGPPNDRAILSVAGLRFAIADTEDLTKRTAQELLTLVDEMRRPAATVRKAAATYRSTEGRLLREIHSRLQRRYALSVTAILLLMLGSTLAMKLRNSLPLTIYIWAFLPSVLDLILITSGGQMIRDGHTFGVAVLWSGNVGLCLLLLHSFWRVSRN